MLFFFTTKLRFFCFVTICREKHKTLRLVSFISEMPQRSRPQFLRGHPYVEEELADLQSSVDASLDRPEVPYSELLSFRRRPECARPLLVSLMLMAGQQVRDPTSLDDNFFTQSSPDFTIISYCTIVSFFFFVSFSALRRERRDLLQRVHLPGSGDAHELLPGERCGGGGAGCRHRRLLRGH